MANDVVYGIDLDVSGVIKETNNVKKATNKMEDSIKKSTVETKKQEKAFKSAGEQGKKSFKGLVEGASNLKGGLLAVAGAFTGVFLGLKKLQDNQRTLINMQAVSGKTADETKRLRNEIQQTAGILGKDLNQTFISSIKLQKAFGIESKEALSLIEKGFYNGADASGELLSQIKEYPAIMKQAGLSAEGFISVMAESEKLGVYADKGVDAIKEGMLALRELTDATQKALKGIGINVDKMQSDIRKGNITYFEAMQSISKALRLNKSDTKAVGAVYADVFKGAGEDAGEFITQLDKVSTKLKDNNSEAKKFLTDSQKAISMISTTVNFATDAISTAYVKAVEGATNLFTFLDGAYKTMTFNSNTLTNKNKEVNKSLVDTAKTTYNTMTGYATNFYNGLVSVISGTVEKAKELNEQEKENYLQSQISKMTEYYETIKNKDIEYSNFRKIILEDQKTQQLELNNEEIKNEKNKLSILQKMQKDYKDNQIKAQEKFANTITNIGVNSLKTFFVAGLRGQNALEQGFKALKNAVIDLAATLAAKAAIFGILNVITGGTGGTLLNFLGFKEGVLGLANGAIGLQGAGTSTSDSIPARLSVGESVMTARATSMFAPQLAQMEKYASGKVNYGGNYSGGYASGTIGVNNNSALIQEIRDLKMTMSENNQATNINLQGESMDDFIILFKESLENLNEVG